MPLDDLSRREAPPRLAEGSDDAAKALRAFTRNTQADGLEESVAWRRLAQRLPVGSARRWFWSGAFVAAAAAAVILARRPPAPVETIAARPAPALPVVEPLAPARAAGGLRRLALSSRAIALTAGPAALAQSEGVEATVDLAPESAASASADAAWVRVFLERGEVGLHVAKRVAGGPGFEVVAGDYHFRVLGTRFRVARGARAGTPVELWVDEGRVAVSRDGRALGVVGAGGHWDTRPAARPAARAVAARPVRRAEKRLALARVTVAPRDEPEAPPRDEPEAPPRSRCAQLAEAGATAREAVGCYLAVARGRGLAAETALYEVARLRRDVLGDGAGALEALQQSRARFPAGMLRQEVDLSIVELLPKLNRHREAIDEIGRLLAQGGGLERGVDSAAELHVLRGNIYREVLEDFARAERDYADAEEARAPVVGDATFLRGVCLQALGRADDARATFDRYLAAGQRRFAEESRRRLKRLGR